MGTGQDGVNGPPAAAAERSALHRRTRARSLLLTLAAGAVSLGVFDYLSAGSGVARRALIADRPPVYGRFQPGFAKIGSIALALALAGAFGAFLVARSERLRGRWLLPVAIAFFMCFAAAVAVVGGSAKAYTDPLERTRPADYQADVPVVRDLGIRAFVEQHPELMSRFKSVHSRTHPPGPVIFLSLLQSAFPNHLIPRAIVMALLSAMVLIPVWFLARRMYGERAATVAVLLMAVAPGPAVFAFTSMDAVYATLIAGTGAALFFALGPGGTPGKAFAVGALVGAVTFMTYGVVFVTAGAVVYALASSSIRDAARRLAVAAAGGFAALVLMRIVLGFDLLASFRAGYEILADESDRSYVYWIFGNPGVWLTFAGLPIAALSVREIFEFRPRYLLALIVPLVLIDLNHKFAGETERIGLFAYPFFAAAAAGWFVRWESGRRRPAIVAGLVGFTALQAIALEALYYTFW